MKISALTLPKDRSLRVANDDTLLILPDTFGVFDGATAPQKSRLAGQSSGRVASQAAASAVARLEEPLAEVSPRALCDAISERIAAQTAALGLEGKPSTTMALVVLGAQEVRFLAVGDSGFRVNGREIIRHEKLIDDISTAARVATFAEVRKHFSDLDEVEALVRQVSFEGQKLAVSQGILSAPVAREITERVIATFADRVDANSIAAFLAEGIREQFKFANRTDHPMGFSTLNTDVSSLADFIDRRIPRAEVDTIEVFSDGYFLIPQATGVAAWEAGLVESEAEDPHHLGRFAGVKGGTRKEFADDRSVLVISEINGL